MEFTRKSRVLWISTPFGCGLYKRDGGRGNGNLVFGTGFWFPLKFEKGRARRATTELVVAVFGRMGHPTLDLAVIERCSPPEESFRILDSHVSALVEIKPIIGLARD